MDELVHNFPWDSDDQRKGYEAFVQWARAKGVASDVRPVDLFFIQHDHESHLYWLELVGGQVNSLQDEILTLRNDLVGLKRVVETLTYRVAEMEQKSA